MTVKAAAAHDRPRYWWLAPVLAAVMLFTGLGGFAAHMIYHGGRSFGDANAQPSETPSPSSSATRAEGAGPSEVALTADAENYPLGPAVRKLLQNYFNAINDKNFSQWVSVVTANRQRQTSRSAWLQDYRSTTDGNIVVYRIEQAPDNGLRVLLDFTSTQDVSDAPKDLPSGCIQWQVVYPLAYENGAWKLDFAVSSASPQRQVCQ